MVLIIMIAFSNFFSLLNQNMTDDDAYIDSFTGVLPIDSFIATYFITLGEFQYDNYSKGVEIQEKYIVWFMFFLGSFLCCVVFMNMLIAIMGETFSQV